MEKQEKLVRTFVWVYFRDEEGTTDEIHTYINLTPEEAAKYYLGKTFNRGTGGTDCLMKSYLIRCYRVEEYNEKGGWKTICEDCRKAFKIAGNEICRCD